MVTCQIPTPLLDCDVLFGLHYRHETHPGQHSSRSCHVRFSAEPSSQFKLGSTRRISCELILKPGHALQQDCITLSCCMVPRRMLIGYSCPASFATDACTASTSEDILDWVGITIQVFNRHPRPSGCPHGSTNVATKEHHSFQREATNSVITALPAIDRLGAKQQASTCKPEFRLHLFGEHLAHEQIHGASRTLVVSFRGLLDGPVRHNTSLVCQLLAKRPD